MFVCRDSYAERGLRGPAAGSPPGLRGLQCIQIMRELVEGLRLTGIEKVTLIRDRKTGTIHSPLASPYVKRRSDLERAFGRSFERIRVCPFQ